MADPPHPYRFSVRFEARGDQRVNAWVIVGDDVVLGPLLLTEAQTHEMGCLMEQAVIAMAEAVHTQSQDESTGVVPGLRAAQDGTPRRSVAAAG